MPIQTVNPATGKTLKSYSPITDAVLEGKIETARQRFSRHSDTPFVERSSILKTKRRRSGS